MPETCPYCKGTGIVHSTVATRLVILREKRGVNQDVVAEACHVSRAQIANLERGRGAPSIDTLVRMAEFFNVSIDYMLGREP